MTLTPSAPPAAVSLFLAAGAGEDGLPSFAGIRAEHYRPAFDYAEAEAEAEIESIVGDPDPPAFGNTIVPLERAGDLLARIVVTLQTVVGSDPTDEILALEAELSPRWVAYQDSVLRNPGLFARVRAVHGAATELGQDQAYLVGRYLDRMVRAGAGRPGELAGRLTQISERLSALSAEFSKRLVADTTELAVVVGSEAELDGLNPADVQAARRAAEAKGLPGQFLIPLTYPTGHPFLKQLTNGELRERIMTASLSRCRRGNDNDTRGIVLEIVRLRAEQARLLGHPSYASWATGDETARTPQAVAGLLEPLAAAAAEKARAEHDALRELAGGPVEAWDWPYYAERMRAAQHDVDTYALRPYFEAERVLAKGVFYAANLVYGLSFAERADLCGWNEDCRVFEVSDEDGSRLGLYVLELYAREGKRGGARSHSLVQQSRLLGRRAVVCNVFAVPRPAPGEPTLLTLDAVVALFHEFGHALHALLSDVAYPSTSGMNVFRDFIEYPAQVNEMWALWPEVVASYAVHADTGERLPGEVIDRIRTSGTFNQGFGTSEHLAAAMLDQAWHTIAPGEEGTDADAFQALALRRAGLDNPAIPSRYASQYFQHIFGGEYAARYYSYMWSEVLAADTIEWFTEHADDLRGAGQRFRERLLAVGGGTDPLVAYRD
ncbi:MAG TPA: M3 family metallopeptidase, partial [Trebonia sp.]